MAYKGQPCSTTGHLLYQLRYRNPHKGMRVKVNGPYDKDGIVAKVTDDTNKDGTLCLVRGQGK